jgi:hypothetical protein
MGQGAVCNVTPMRDILVKRLRATHREHLPQAKCKVLIGLTHQSRGSLWQRNCKKNEVQYRTRYVQLNSDVHLPRHATITSFFVSSRATKPWVSVPESWS